MSVTDFDDDVSDNSVGSKTFGEQISRAQQKQLEHNKTQFVAVQHHTVKSRLQV